ncbi:MAG TPA: HD domain-containing protein [Candidatus Paceibacterota bacterium]
MSSSFEKTIAFSHLIHAFQRVERRTHVPGTERWENDAEHSYALAMMAWYLIDSLRLSYDKEKVFRYALAHDFVEVYAGDTWSFGKADTKGKSKAERETESQAKLASGFSEFADLHATIGSYESRKDEESRFVYALDKVMPILAGFAQQGRDWKGLGVSFMDVYEYKKEKILAQKEVSAIFEELMGAIDKNREDYFNS